MKTSFVLFCSFVLCMIALFGGASAQMPESSTVSILFVSYLAEVMGLWFSFVLARFHFSNRSFLTPFFVLFLFCFYVYMFSMAHVSNDVSHTHYMLMLCACLLFRCKCRVTFSPPLMRSSLMPLTLVATSTLGPTRSSTETTLTIPKPLLLVSPVERTLSRPCLSSSRWLDV